MSARVPRAVVDSTEVAAVPENFEQWPATMRRRFEAHILNGKEDDRKISSPDRVPLVLTSPAVRLR